MTDSYIKQMRQLRKEDMKTGTQMPKMPSLGFCIVKIYVNDFACLATLRFVHVILAYTRLAMLDRLIGFIQSDGQSLLVGLFYVFLMFLTMLLNSLCAPHFERSYHHLTNRIRASLINVVYKKVSSVRSIFSSSLYPIYLSIYLSYICVLVVRKRA